MSSDSSSSEDNGSLEILTLFKKFIAGGTAGAVSVTAVAPLERTKIILQVQNSSRKIPPHKRYKGLIDCLTRIPKEQGFLSFWRGNTASVLRCFPYHAINFSIKDIVRETLTIKLNPEAFSSHLLINLFAGGIAGATSLFLIYPLDYARTRLAMDFGHKHTREYQTIRECLKDAYHTDGIKGIYRGLGISVFGVFIYRATYFGVYDTGVDVIPPHLHKVWVQLLLAESTSVMAGLVSFPIDTVRRSMMMQSGKKPEGFTYLTATQYARHIYTTQGVRGFYRGALANVLRGTGGALMLLLYDNLNYLLLGDKGHSFYSEPRAKVEDFHSATISTMKTKRMKDDSSPSSTEEPRKKPIHGSRGPHCDF